MQLNVSFNPGTKINPVSHEVQLLFSLSPPYAHVLHVSKHGSNLLVLVLKK